MWALIELVLTPILAFCFCVIFFLKREGSIKILKIILQVKTHLPSDAISLKEVCCELETSGEKQ